MSILPTPTQLEEDILAKNDHILSVSEAAHNLAVKLRAAHAAFWALPDERLLGVLNANIGATMATFAANTALGQAVNGALDSVDRKEFPTRAPVTMGREDVVFDGQHFVIVSDQES